MILTRQQMTGSEEEAFRSGASAEDLMEAAGRQMAEFVMQNHPSPGRCLVYAGKGHNGGDVLVAARHLALAGWDIAVEVPDPVLAPLTASRFERLGPVVCTGRSQPMVILDGLLGIGARGAPREPVAAAIREINRLRKAHSAWVLAADLPSGLDADSGAAADPCVEADATMTMGFAKPGLLADPAVNFVGRLAVAGLAGVIPPPDADPSVVLTPGLLAPLLPPRPFDTHKGMAGRVAVIAGSRGFTGAARLSSAGAVLGGAGLVTLCVKAEAYGVLASSALPEVMVRQVGSYEEVLAGEWDAIAIGPGLSQECAEEIRSVVAGAMCPCVVDADALNVVARDPSLLSRCRGPRLLTPHPGEMERLEAAAGRSRAAWASDFAAKYPVILLLKGARTVIAEKNRPLAYNSTGHPGMAGGGMGDVLTGVCAAQIAQGKSPGDAAQIGAWICGRAAEISLLHGASAESLRASDVLAFLGAAFQSIRARAF